MFFFLAGLVIILAGQVKTVNHRVTRTVKLKSLMLSPGMFYSTYRIFSNCNSRSMPKFLRDLRSAGEEKEEMCICFV